jgi:hypothetical protein
VITDQEGRAELGRLPLTVETDYTVTARFDGTVSYAPTTAPGSSLIQFNHAPVCEEVIVQTVNGSKPYLWPSNGKFDDLKLSGATDPDGDSLTYYFRDIFQDEDQPLAGDFDATITNGCTAASARSERLGNEDGRVYHVFFTVTDGKGGSCDGVVRIPVDHDQSNIDAIDDGPLYNSLGPGTSVPACTP